MRDYGTAIETQIASLSGVMVRSLVWIAAKNRDTGETENAGFWNGLDELTITIGGVSRTYTGAGALLSLSPITGTIGPAGQDAPVSLSGVPPECWSCSTG